MIDLSDRIIQPATRTRAPNGNLKWHPLRRALQVLCGLAFVSLPLTGMLRLDLRRDEFWFAGHRMAAHDLALLFWLAMLGVWGLVAVSFLYGRLWCGWVCPQTLASDFADSLKTRLDKAFHARPGQPAFVRARTVWAALIVTVALATGVALADYWFAPRTVALATLHPTTDVPAALTVYLLTAVIAADMLWLRRRFCSHACPYGALIGLLADKNTLAVRYLDERHDDCIQCGKCVVDCPMGIDIKKGVGQYACIGCGECVDSCNTVLGKRGKAGLIEFRYGLEPERATHALPLSQRLGLWDGRRAGVLVTLAAFFGVVLFLLFGRMPLTASVIANGAIVRDTARVQNTYLLTVANQTPTTNRYVLTVRGLPAGAVLIPSLSPSLRPHEERSFPVTLSVPAGTLREDSRTRVQLHVSGGRQQTLVPTIFYTPARAERNTGP